MPELAKLAHSAPPHDPAYPFILAAGERRSDTSNTAVRRHRLAPPRALRHLRISPQDAEALGCADGEVLRVVTRRGEVEAEVEISDMMQPGNISLPNGQGLDYRNAEGRGGAPGRGAQRGDRLHPARLPRRHALAQVRAGAPGTAGDARRYERLSQGGRS
ncbi:molybdopterin dinucleotide binding domain-containing protein [Pseudomonas aeruginosa]|nr:molybdopterin dinucleotide binding domain-containing protein [Pseudomonas aeruginosa]